MLKRIVVMIALSGIGYAQTGEELRGLMRVVLANLQRADGQQVNYAYTRSSVRSDLNSDGSVKKRGREVVVDVTPLAPRKREDTSWLKEFPEALEFKKVGEEEIGGRVAWVLECSPRAGYKAQSLRGRVFEKTRGRVWIDVADSQLVRVDAAVFDTVSIGWGMAAKIQKGTRFQIDRRKLADGAWLPESQTIRFAAKVMMVKSLAIEDSARFSGYRRHSFD
jgi:hypothetical protein